MTSADRHDLMPAPQEELEEWVTPKISLMENFETAGKTFRFGFEASNSIQRRTILGEPHKKYAPS
jgi:hypothetical protein